VSPLALLGWYSSAGAHGNAWVWLLDRGQAPIWFGRRSHTVGNVVLLDANLDTSHGRVELRHQQATVLQQMRLGALWPALYLLCWLAMWLGCQKAHPHFDHPFAVDARRSAGQVVDVIGLVEKAKHLAHGGR
jgi:hypothetical protein